MKPVFPLVLFFLMNLFICPATALEKTDLVSTETFWIKRQGLDTQLQPAVLPQPSSIELEFHSPNPRSLLEKGSFKLQRKILLNGSGTEITPEVFSWDLQLEVNYKFI